MAKKYHIGFDLGGTKMMAALFDENFKIVGRRKRRTKADKGADKVFERIVRTINDVCDENGASLDEVAGIGIGSPGPLDPYEGVIIHTPNLGFENFPLKKKLQKELDLPVVVDNDVNVGTYGEYHFGAAKGYKHVIGIFPGTGIGGGLVLDGRLYRGAKGSAGEVGHMIVQPDGPLCGCGQRGCIEAIASKTAIAKEAVALVSRGKAPVIADNAGTDIRDIKSGVLAKAYDSGDPDIKEVIHYAARYLGTHMANLVNVFDPEVILLGGGIIEAMPKPFLSISTEAMKEHAMAFNCKGVKVVAAKLEDDAVVCGGAKLIAEHLTE